MNDHQHGMTLHHAVGAVLSETLATVFLCPIKVKGCQALSKSHNTASFICQAPLFARFTHKWRHFSVAPKLRLLLLSHGTQERSKAINTHRIPDGCGGVVCVTHLYKGQSNPLAICVFLEGDVWIRDLSINMRPNLWNDYMETSLIYVIQKNFQDINYRVTMVLVS